MTDENISDADNRSRQALEFRKTGKAYQAIADELGYTGSSEASTAVLSAIQATPSEPPEVLRTLEAERLDALMQGIWSTAIGGDLSALDRVLKIMDRRAKLTGLDEPTKHDITSGGIPPDVARAMLAAGLAAADETRNAPLD